MWPTLSHASLVSKRYSSHVRSVTTVRAQGRIGRLQQTCTITRISTNQSPNRNVFQVERVLFWGWRALSPGLLDGKGTGESCTSPWASTGGCHLTSAGGWNWLERRQGGKAERKGCTGEWAPSANRWTQGQGAMWWAIRSKMTEPFKT